MGKVEDLHLFTMVVEHRGIANAAARLNIAKSAVSRRLSLLEDRYSTKLIDRSPGRWEVTETGRELFQRASRAVHDFQEIETDFKSTHADISGPLTISVPREFGFLFLSRLLVTFNNKYPEIQLTADFDDRVIDRSDAGAAIDRTEGQAQLMRLNLSVMIAGLPLNMTHCTSREPNTKTRKQKLNEMNLSRIGGLLTDV